MSILSVCAPEASSFHSIFVYAEYQTSTGFRTICDVRICARCTSNEIFSEQRKFTL